MRPRKTIVKLSSWAAAVAAPLLARLPGTRFVVVVRDPWKTVASFLAEPPHWYGACRQGANGGKRSPRARWQCSRSPGQRLIAQPSDCPPDDPRYPTMMKIAVAPVSIAELSVGTAEDSR